IEHEGRSVVYATDTEHYACVDPALRALAEGADVLVYDSQYTPEEYRGDGGRSRVGWGHSTYVAGAELARAAGVGRYVLFHHDPQRTDAGVADLERRAPELFPPSGAGRAGVGIGGGARAPAARPGRGGAACGHASAAEVTGSRPVPILADRDPLSTSRLSLLVDLASLLAREVDFDQLLGTACERLARALRADRATIWLVDAERGDLVTRVALLPELPTLRQPLERGIAGYVARTGEVVRVEDASRDTRFDPSVDKVTGYTTRSMLVAPIREDARAPIRGVVQLLNRREGTFDDEDDRYLVALTTQLARALALTTLRGTADGAPGVVLRGPFNRIVGRSALLAAVYERIQLAAQTEATVVLRGETGT